MCEWASQGLCATPGGWLRRQVWISDSGAGGELWMEVRGDGALKRGQLLFSRPGELA